MTIALSEITANDARSLTDRIKVAVEGTWELIKQAYQTGAHLALGYPSWDDYCTREFGTSRLRLPREDRQEAVASLREAGLSIRAIAAATGASDQTVQKDLRAVVNHYTSEPVAGPSAGWIEPAPADFDDEPADFTTDDEPALTQEECEALDSVLQEDAAAELPEPARITGTDGKSYPLPPKPTTPARKPITDAFVRAVFDLGKKVTTVVNLADDDRFKRNADQLAQQKNDLIRARDALQRVIDQLPN